MYMDKRPPPYFPQTSLNPQNENRYKKFKVIVGLAILGAILLLSGAVIGIYYLISWIMA